MNLLDVSVIEDESGPVVMLSGEADLTVLPELNAVLDEQILAGARIVTVDLSRLRFADSAILAALAAAARTLSEQGGRLQLRYPQPTVARVLALTGMDQVLMVHCEPAPD